MSCTPQQKATARKAMSWCCSCLRTVEVRLVGRLGVHMNPWYAAMRYLAQSVDAGADAQRLPYRSWLELRQNDLVQRVTRIGKLSFIAEHISGDTGCEEWQALAYLLCGEIPTLPWVRAKRICRPAIGDTWLIEVGAPIVPAGQVKHAYADAREVASPKCPEQRSIRPSIADRRRLYEFVRAKQAVGETWAQIREEWNAQEDVHQYPATKAIEVAYLRARRRIEGSSEQQTDDAPTGSEWAT